MSASAIIFAAALSVYDFATNSIAERVAGADPAICLSRFAEYPPSKGRLGFPRCIWEKPFPANEKFWLKDVDFSCVSPWNDSCGAQRAGTLISKRHIVFAAHFPLWKGVRILFVGNEGDICPCYVGASKIISGTDIQVAALDSEVTPNIHPAKILPEDYGKYLRTSTGLPVITFNQSEEALLMETSLILRDRIIAWPGREDRKNFRKMVVGGDSGNPAFLLIGNEPILLYCLKTGVCGGGPAIHRYRKEIQQAMDELYPGYKLEEFDFKSLEGKLK